MSEVRVLVNYDGEWVNSTYVGGQTKGIVISEDIAYQGLVERVYGVVGVDPHEYKLVLKTRYESKFPTQPVEIINDDDLAFFIKENLSRDISSRIPLCTTLERRSFPYGRVESSENSNTAGVGLLKWRMQSQDESLVPLQINCWPSVSGNETYVNTEHDASSMFDLRKCCHFSTSSSSQRGSSCEGDSW